jgi:hypothetical protein
MNVMVMGGAEVEVKAVEEIEWSGASSGSIIAFDLTVADSSEQMSICDGMT